MLGLLTLQKNGISQYTGHQGTKSTSQMYAWISQSNHLGMFCIALARSRTMKLSHTWTKKEQPEDTSTSYTSDITAGVGKRLQMIVSTPIKKPVEAAISAQPRTKVYDLLPQLM